MILGRIIFDEMHGFVSSDYSELTDKQLYEIADRANKYDSLISEIEKLKDERLSLLKSIELILDEDDGGMAAEQARQTIIRIEGGKS